MPTGAIPQSSHDCEGAVSGFRAEKETALQENAQQEELTDYSDDGVDLTLIRYMLAKTPAERLEFLDSQIADIEAIRKLNAR